jgi:sterol desaturase/sphingolipid hydroxylase (fatty acid hydroxylase superfamily)
MTESTPPSIPVHPEVPRHFGSGWISGVLAVALGAIGLGAVLCFHFPSVLTMPELRRLYPVPIIRGILHVVLVSAFLLGVVSVCLRRRWVLGAIGISLSLIATLLGGSRVPIDGELRSGPFLGLDWFLVSLILYSAIFIPLERWFALRPDQPIFRPSWRVDLTYFFISSLAVQITTILTLKPAMVFFSWASAPSLRTWVSSQPLWVQFFEILILSDLTQYWIHRLFHTSWLWPFHAVHHSVEQMDWLAGSRLHIVDVAVTRGLTYVPTYILGFADPAIFAYVGLVSVQATFIHANIRFTFGPLRWLIATPQFHHWHHAADREGIDKNFAVHLPLIDWLFGTFYLPEKRWPSRYGLSDGERLPEWFTLQFLYPFRRRK